jgi:hypothetical protein
MEMNTFNQQVFCFFVVLAAIISGCAAKSVDLVRDGKVNVETVPSRHGHVSGLSVLTSESGIKITGDVHGSTHKRGYIQGHIDVEVISPDGTMQAKETFKYQNRGGKSRTTPFSAEIPVLVPDGRTIRVIHHCCGSH